MLQNRAKLNATRTVQDPWIYIQLHIQVVQVVLVPHIVCPPAGGNKVGGPVTRYVARLEKAPVSRVLLF